MKKLIFYFLLITVMLTSSCAETTTSEQIQTPQPTQNSENDAAQNYETEDSRTESGYNNVFSEDGNLKSISKLFVMLGQTDPMFTPTDKALETLENNKQLFIGNQSSKAELDKMTDFEINYKMLNKNINKYGDKLSLVKNAYVIAIQEENVGNITISILQLVDLDSNIYYVYSVGEYNDIFDGDTVDFYALPVGQTSYENVGGGSTNAIVFAGCSFEKSENLYND